MNVYRAAALSALGILGWKSAVDNSRQISVPDFRSRQERDLYRNDEDSPFYMNGKEPSLPNALFNLGEEFGWQNDAGTFRHLEQSPR